VLADSQSDRPRDLLPIESPSVVSSSSVMEAELQMGAGRVDVERQFIAWLNFEQTLAAPKVGLIRCAGTQGLPGVSVRRQGAYPVGEFPGRRASRSGRDNMTIQQQPLAVFLECFCSPPVVSFPVI
jgi:hypothetical protein